MAEEVKKKKWRDPSWVAGHIERYLSDPEGAHLWDSTIAGGPGPIPTLLLTTTGRRSGEPRMAPVIYLPLGDAYAVIGSKGGWPDHPVWYLNLLANPECDVRVRGDRFRAKARTAEGAERDAIWAEMAKLYPPYDAYQARTTRPIPVIVLEPIRA